MSLGLHAIHDGINLFCTLGNGFAVVPLKFLEVELYKKVELFYPFNFQVADEADKFKCVQCKKKYKTKEGLSRHMNTKHSVPGQHNSCPEKPKIHLLELCSAIRRAAQKLGND